MSNESFEIIHEHREELKDLAESDLPANWVAQAVLDAADEAE